MFDRVVVVGAGFIGCSFLHICMSRGLATALVESNEAKCSQIEKQIPLFEEKDFDWGQFYEHVDLLGGLSDIQDSDLIFCCVGADPHPDGYDYSAVSSVVTALIENNIKAELVIRTTLDPMSLTRVASELQTSDIDGWFYPEYLREGSALSDIATNANHLCRLSGNGDALEHLMKLLSFEYELTDYKAAAFNKIVSNVWRATKISFVNQITKQCLEMDIDPHVVSDLFLADKKNVSASYLRMGGPFGGYCLPKETEYLAISRTQLKGGLFESVLAVNDGIINLIIDFFENLQN